MDRDMSEYLANFPRDDIMGECLIFYIIIAVYFPLFGGRSEGGSMDD